MSKSVFDIKADLDVLWAGFSTNHSTFADNGNKAAAARARKSINEIKKLITGYKKASVDQTKIAKISKPTKPNKVAKPE
jgi:hypothetical protein